MDRLIKILNDIGIPYAYNHFAEGESPDNPFICYFFKRSNNFSADNKSYHKTSEVHIELYTDKKDLDLEERLENVLDKNSIFYEKDETYIESEKMYEVLYSFEMEVRNVK